MSVNRTEDTFTDSALNHVDKMGKERAARVLCGLPVAFRQAAFASLDDAELQRQRKDEPCMLDDQLLECFVRRKVIALGNRSRQLARLLGNIFRQRLQHRFLAAEVVIHGGPGQARRICDVLHIRSAEPFRNEEKTSLFKDGLPLGGIPRGSFPRDCCAVAHVNVHFFSRHLLAPHLASLLGCCKGSNAWPAPHRRLHRQVRYPGETMTVLTLTSIKLTITSKKAKMISHILAV